MKSHTRMMKLEKIQYDVVQKEYDSNVGSILEQLKQKVVEFFGTMQQKSGETIENAQEKVRETKKNVASIVDETK